jgi:hypothetical protein
MHTKFARGILFVRVNCIADVSEMLPFLIFNMMSGGLTLYQMGHLFNHFAVRMETKYLRAKFHITSQTHKKKTLAIETL